MRSDPFTNSFFTLRLYHLNDELFDYGSGAPLVNVSETSKEFKLDLLVQGMKRDDFDINIEDGILTISSEKGEEKKDGDKN